MRTVLTTREVVCLIVHSLEDSGVQIRMVFVDRRIHVAIRPIRRHPDVQMWWM